MESDYEWYVNTDLSAFSGKWIAILDKKVVASDIDAKRVVKEIKDKHPNSKPLIAKISNETLIL